MPLKELMGEISGRKKRYTFVKTLEMISSLANLNTRINGIAKKPNSFVREQNI